MSSVICETISTVVPAVQYLIALSTRLRMASDIESPSNPASGPSASRRRVQLDRLRLRLRPHPLDDITVNRLLESQKLQRGQKEYAFEPISVR